MKLMLLPLLLLMFASILGVARGLGYIDFLGDPMGANFYNSSGYEYGSEGNLTVGENITIVGTEFAEIKVSTIISCGVLGLLITSVAFAGIMGIQVMGSGLAEFSVMAIFRWAVSYGLWLIFSVFALVMFMEVPVFGLPLYFLLTFFYCVGVLDTLRLGSG